MLTHLILEHIILRHLISGTPTIFLESISSRVVRRAQFLSTHSIIMAKKTIHLPKEFQQIPGMCDFTEIIIFDL